MCNKPLIRAETYERYTNKKGTTSYKAEFITREEFDKFGDKYLNNRYRKITPVGCGQCVPCMLEYSRDKATQIMLEKNFGYKNCQPYPDGTVWMLTATYDNEHLKTHKYARTDTGEIFEGVSLNLEDDQKFMKLLRYYYPNMKMKRVVAGEYGSQSGRPHYHSIIYGLPLDQTQFKTWNVNKWGQRTWIYKDLNEIWGNGMVNIARVEWQNAAYVARYALKKAFKKDKAWYYAQGMLPEFIHWSNGIGRNYFLKNIEKIYDTDTVPIVNNKGAIVKPPKSYDRMLKEIDPELYEKVKYDRQKHTKSNELILRSQTDLTPEERRTIDEARMLQVMKDLRTEV